MLQVSLNYPTTSIKAVPFSRWRTHPAGRARASRAVDQTLLKARSVKTAKRLSKVQPCHSHRPTALHGDCWKAKRSRPPIISWSIAGLLRANDNFERDQVNNFNKQEPGEYKSQIRSEILQELQMLIQAKKVLSTHLIFHCWRLMICFRSYLGLLRAVWEIFLFLVSYFTDRKCCHTNTWDNVHFVNLFWTTLVFSAGL